MLENLVMVGMAGLQVFIVRFFFQGARKGKQSERLPVESAVVLTGFCRLRLGFMWTGIGS